MTGPVKYVSVTWPVLAGLAWLTRVVGRGVAHSPRLCALGGSAGALEIVSPIVPSSRAFVRLPDFRHAR